MSQDQQNKPTGSNQAPEKKSATPQAGWKRFLGKKWAFPAIYMSAAALILTFMWWYQDPGEFSIDPKTINEGVVVEEPSGQQDAINSTVPVGEDAVAVNTGAKESMKWPVIDANMIDVMMGFYDEGATDEVKASALIEFNGEWYTHNGIDITHPEGQVFDVTAALGGKVTLVDDNAVVGLQVEVTHEDGLVTVYQSLGEVAVKLGDEVKQDQVIGKAGRSVFEKDHGIHVHFEVRKDGIPVNPDEYLAQQ
jgi:stage II sporulation protein Q